MLQTSALVTLSFVLEQFKPVMKKQDEENSEKKDPKKKVEKASKKLGAAQAAS
jgi:hypothetical protein